MRVSLRFFDHLRNVRCDVSQGSLARQVTIRRLDDNNKHPSGTVLLNPQAQLRVHPSTDRIAGDGFLRDFFTNHDRSVHLIKWGIDDCAVGKMKPLADLKILVELLGSQAGGFAQHNKYNYSKQKPEANLGSVLVRLFDR